MTDPAKGRLCLFCKWFKLEFDTNASWEGTSVWCDNMRATGGAWDIDTVGGNVREPRFREILRRAETCEAFEEVKE